MLADYMDFCLAQAFAAILAGFGYGMVGVLVGVPIGFAINLTRGLLR